MNTATSHEQGLNTETNVANNTHKLNVWLQRLSNKHCKNSNTKL